MIGNLRMRDQCPGRRRTFWIVAAALLWMVALPLAVMAQPIIGETVGISNVPALSVSKWDRVDPIPATWRIQYTIRVQNNTDLPMANVLVTDVLPAGMYFVSATDGGLGSGSSPTVTWTLASLAAGASNDLVLMAGTHSNVRGVLTNTVCAQADGVAKVCAQQGTTITAPPPAATPTATPAPGPWTCPRPGYLGAPHGLPDFDMRQPLPALPDRARSASASLSGTAAFANALWYLDAQAENALAAAFGLVSSDGGWSDHSPDNVPPLLANLGAHLGAGEQGISLEGAYSGLASFFSAQGVLGAFDVEVVKDPTALWLRDRARWDDGVAVVLLGLWQDDVRVGGHWVAVCCVDHAGSYVEFSDPWYDGAAAGGAGRSWGGLPADPAVHNDTANVSYDRYTLISGEAGFVPLGYGGLSLGEIAAVSEGQNGAADLYAYQGEFDPLRPVQVVADYAVFLQPLSGYPVQEPTPEPTVTATPTETETETPTPTPTLTPTLTATPEPTATAMVYWLQVPIIVK